MCAHQAGSATRLLTLRTAKQPQSPCWQRRALQLFSGAQRPSCSQRFQTAPTATTSLKAVFYGCFCARQLTVSQPGKAHSAHCACYTAGSSLHQAVLHSVAFPQCSHASALSPTARQPPAPACSARCSVQSHVKQLGQQNSSPVYQHKHALLMQMQCSTCGRVALAITAKQVVGSLAVCSIGMQPWPPGTPACKTAQTQLWCRQCSLQ